MDTYGSILKSRSVAIFIFCGGRRFVGSYLNFRQVCLAPTTPYFRQSISAASSGMARSQCAQQCGMSFLKSILALLFSCVERLNGLRQDRRPSKAARRLLRPCGANIFLITGSNMFSIHDLTASIKFYLKILSQIHSRKSVKMTAAQLMSAQTR